MRRPLRRKQCGPTLVWLPVATAIAIAACDNTSSTAGSVTVRDSAGITIVQNGATAPAVWRLSDVPVVTFDPNLPVEQMPLDPTAAFGDRNGRIIVGDGNQAGWHAILVYDSSGVFLTRMGGPGRGPGEFGGQLWWAGPYRGDSIVAWDRRGPSMKIFGADGGYSREVPIPTVGRMPPEGTFRYSNGFHGAFDDGALLTSSEGILEVPQTSGPTWYKHLMIAVEPGSAAWDTIGEFDLAPAHWDGNEQSFYLFGPQTTIQPYGNDLLVANSASYEYRILDRDGQLRQIVRRDYEPVPVEAADVEAVIAMFMGPARQRNATDSELQQLRNRVEGYARASHKPPYSSVLVDAERRVWVERFRWLDPWDVPPDPQPTTWDVFAASGEWLAEVVVPPRIVILSVSHDRLFGARIDDDDVRHIVVYRVLRGE